MSAARAKLRVAGYQMIGAGYVAKEYIIEPSPAANLKQARQGPITLVYSAHDEVHNDAVALRDFLLGRQTKRKPETARR